MTNGTLRLGIDLDGVLADFTSAYLRKLTYHNDGKCLLPDGEEPPCWNWATAVGYSADCDSKAWKEITTEPFFWSQLEPRVETPQALQTLQQLEANGHDVYYITNRPGLAPKAQTWLWFLKQGYPAPTILISDDKGPVAKGLKLTHFIDDKAENVVDVATHSPSTKCFLLHTRYNADHAMPPGVVRVKSLREFFDALS